jgi:hypothetical protein
LTASGDVVVIQWPRKLSLRYNRPWLWVTKADAERFYEAERPCLERAGLPMTSPDRAEPSPAGTHVAETKPVAGHGLPAVTAETVEKIFGPRCPHCLYARNDHHWNCPTELSQRKDPRFP